MHAACSVVVAQELTIPETVRWWESRTCFVAPFKSSKSSTLQQRQFRVSLKDITDADVMPMVVRQLENALTYVETGVIGAPDCVDGPSDVVLAQLKFSGWHV